MKLLGHHKTLLQRFQRAGQPSAAPRALEPMADELATAGYLIKDSYRAPWGATLAVYSLSPIGRRALA